MTQIAEKNISAISAFISALVWQISNRNTVSDTVKREMHLLNSKVLNFMYMRNIYTVNNFILSMEFGCFMFNKYRLRNITKI